MENFHESFIDGSPKPTSNETIGVAKPSETLANEQHKALTELFAKNANSPISVGAVVAENSQSIRAGTLQKYFDATILQAVNFHELCEQADILNQKLIQHGLVEQVSQSLDSRGIYSLPLANMQYPSMIYSGEAIPKDIPVIDIVSRLQLVPIKRFIAKTGTNIGNNEGDGYLEFQLRNMFGAGESLKLDFTKGTKTHSSYVLNYNQPVTAWWIWDSMLFKNNLTGLLINGFRTNLRSGFVGSSAFNHELSYATEWRKSKVASLNASDTLLFQAGDDLKCSLGHTVVLDKRDNPVSPSKGGFMKLYNELALGKFWKSQIELSQNISWLKNDFITVSCTTKAGYIKNLKPDTNSLKTYDKFQNGGANDIRSFTVKGLGPKDLFDSIGGDAFVAYGVSLFSRLPIKRWAHSNFRLHWFLNGGKLINHNNASLYTLINELSSQHSLSTGVGIVLRHPVARFELNFTLPLACHTGDAVRKGFQYGIGISFL
ncbi:hypothetical protein HG535_0D01860 [Zygotorulaspora mrakii]|uniref:Bacterial surface antigen (D15) domain-containing protein n=1 Tax=Zygotorulaspora mrakii TaxID=42260 RepID=A0A7H9B1G1_ZYGMR|nr:uncharacterized protein HG535_0D01860 [Zygotorulaspora mrakii]QLG72478.1 hypothetical protein HG535_0D01860 [Zygotorulaspora mrakii]